MSNRLSQTLRADVQGMHAYAVQPSAGFAHFNDAAALLEVVDAQRRAETRGAAGGQHVVGAGAVVAQALAGVSAQKDGAGVAQQRLPAVRLVAGDF